MIRRRLTARLARERGQSMVEFALVANLALLLLFAIVQGGVSWYHKMALEEASREAARTAIVSVSLGSTGMQSAARTEAQTVARTTTSDGKSAMSVRPAQCGASTASWNRDSYAGENAQSARTGARTQHTATAHA